MCNNWKWNFLWKYHRVHLYHLLRSVVLKSTHKGPMVQVFEIWHKVLGWLHARSWTDFPLLWILLGPKCVSLFLFFFFFGSSVVGSGWVPGCQVKMVAFLSYIHILSPFFSEGGKHCKLNGVEYAEDSVVSEDCEEKCICSLGQIECVPTCGMEILEPSPDCPRPRLVPPADEECCHSWICLPEGKWC